MAATAHVIPNLEISAPDDMDLHSDSGLDFGDGDIELDLAPATPAHRQDDDVSINDAASVSAMVPGDQDDFMVDHEDFIEEDYVYQDEDTHVITEQPATGHIPATQPQTHQTQTLAVPDEDLLDYSDDEAQQPQKTSYSPSQHEESELQHLEEETAMAHQASAQTSTSENEDTSEQHNQDNQNYEQVKQNADIDGADVHSQASSHHDHQSEAHHEEHDHTHSEDGGVLLQEHESLADDDENEHSDHGISHEDHDETNTVDDQHQDHQSPDLKPVTVNYAGNELWFFKQHDPDDSGDWLLEDLSLAKSSMSDLFQACRASLGDDVSNEHEIGLRFDHLHNLELYEDNTACVAVSLERLVSLYHNLHAQDGNDEPDSFYCSLLFRPRFVTLLSDIAKYADQGSGYSGLEAAVIAGETHFSNVFSGASTEHEATDWDDGEQEEADRDDSGSADENAPQGVDQSDHEGQGQQETHAEYDDVHEQEEYDVNVNEGASSAGVLHQEHDSSHGVDLASGESPYPSHAHANQQQETQVSDSHNKEDAESIARREQKEDDLLDYSDDDVQDDAENTKQADTNEASPSSSTVQGDETGTGEEGANTEVAPGQDDQGNGSNNEVDFHAEDETDTQFNDQLLDGIDDTTQSYQNYVQNFDQEDPFQGFQADGDANQEYAGFEYQEIDQQLQLDFMNGTDFNAGDNSTTALNDFEDTDDFLDLNTGHDWTTDGEPNSNVPEGVGLVHDDTAAQDNEEDDVVEQSAAAVSSTADPETASLTESKDVSPQGLKRSVDEAGHGVDDALDSIDAKRPRV